MLYRFEDFIHRNSLMKGKTPEIILLKFKKVKETPKGFWIESLITHDRKWVSNKRSVPYVFSNKKEAYWNFIERKQRQRWIFKQKIKNIEVMLVSFKKGNYIVNL